MTMGRSWSSFFLLARSCELVNGIVSRDDTNHYVLGWKGANLALQTRGLRCRVAVAIPAAKTAGRNEFGDIEEEINTDASGKMRHNNRKKLFADLDDEARAART